MKKTLTPDIRRYDNKELLQLTPMTLLRLAVAVAAGAGLYLLLHLIRVSYMIAVPIALTVTLTAFWVQVGQYRGERISVQLWLFLKIIISPNNLKHGYRHTTHDRLTIDKG